MQTASGRRRQAPVSDESSFTTCGACQRRGAYVVPGRQVIRCRYCPARFAFEGDGPAQLGHSGAADVGPGRHGTGTPATVAPRPQEGSGGSRRVWVAEDDPAVCALLQASLNRAGYQVAVFGDGGTVYSAVLEGRPDLLILDIGLPHVDGLTLLTQLRPHVAAPILILSGRTSEGDRVTGLNLGADDYLCKPFSPSELVARVRSLLRRSESSALTAG